MAQYKQMNVKQMNIKQMNIKQMNVELSQEELQEVTGSDWKTASAIIAGSILISASIGGTGASIERAIRLRR